MTAVADAPVDLLRAINYANKIIDWHENMMEEDIPPEWMWPFDEELTKWFENLKAEKKDKANSGSNTSELTEVPMMENELAAGRGR